MEKAIQFSPYAEPLIKSGIYNIKVCQLLDVNYKFDGYDVAEAGLKVAFEGDMVAMNDAEVYSVYPPKDSVGNFEDCLPHMVFHRKTLPWDKQLETAGEKQFTNMPYIALLVISENEGAEEITGTFGELQIRLANIYLPTINDELIDSKQACRVVDIPLNLWADILPCYEDLSYLAHTKGVTLDDKVTDPAVKSEWFSCLIANRYPQSALAMGDNLKHTVYLVSLAGFEDYLILDPEARVKKCKENNIEYVRMYVLYRYSFYVEPNAYDFYTCAKKLKVGCLSADTGKETSDKVKEITELGYVPVNHNFREGSKLISWYRSPLLPGEAPYNEKISVAMNSDQLLHYDPELGMFDITYSAAWQIGRMLALQKTDLTRQIFDWRLHNKSDAVKNQNYKHFAKMVSNSLSKRIVTLQKDEHPEQIQLESDTDIDISDVKELFRSLWRSTVKDFHSGCCAVDDPIGLRGTNVTAFSNSKVQRLIRKRKRFSKVYGIEKAFSQADLLVAEDNKKE